MDDEMLPGADDNGPACNGTDDPCEMIKTQVRWLGHATLDAGVEGIIRTARAPDLTGPTGLKADARGLLGSNHGRGK